MRKLIVIFLLSSGCALFQNPDQLHWYRFDCDAENQVRLQLTYTQLRTQSGQIYDKVEEMCKDPANHVKRGED